MYQVATASSRANSNSLLIVPSFKTDWNEYDHQVLSECRIADTKHALVMTRLRDEMNIDEEVA
jgi:hypothetical protein